MQLLAILRTKMSRCRCSTLRRESVVIQLHHDDAKRIENDVRRKENGKSLCEQECLDEVEVINVEDYSKKDRKRERS